MFVVWGTKTHTDILGESTLKNECQNCHNEINFEVKKYSRKFSLFWIPLFTFSSTYFLACPICQYGYEIQKDQVNNYLEQVN